jgi:hypothetical protein
MNKSMNKYDLIWCPSYSGISTVNAKNFRSARRKAPYPYRKYLGEIVVEIVFELRRLQGYTMILNVSDKSKTVELVRRMFFLAYNACGTASGLGFLQAASNASEDDVWNSVMNRGDYPGGSAFMNQKDNEVRGDYVFGRMMKLNIRFDKDNGTIEISDRKTDINYNRWATKYDSHLELAQDAALSLNLSITE